MTSVRIESNGPGRYRVSGELTFATVREALLVSRDQVQGSPTEFDLSAVSVADSAGLALLVEWYRAGGNTGSVRFVGVPAQLLALAKISDLDKLLPFQAA